MFSCIWEKGLNYHVNLSVVVIKQTNVFKMWPLVLWTSSLHRQGYIVSPSSDKCTYLNKLLWIKVSAKCTKCKSSWLSQTKNAWLRGNLHELHGGLAPSPVLSSPCDVVDLLSPWNASTLPLLLYQGSDCIYQGCLGPVLLWSPLTDSQLRGSIRPFIH